MNDVTRPRGLHASDTARRAVAPRSLPWAAAVALVAACAVDPPVDERPWALVPADDMNPDPDVVEVNLRASVSNVELIEGHETRVWSYDGLVPGPLIEAKVGDRVIVHLANDLGDATTIHWHGLRVPAEMDGVPAMQEPIQPGKRFTYDFTVPDALLAWYHPHLRSDEQVERGLQGAFVVRDPDAKRFGRETLIVLDDVLLDDDDEIAPFSGHMASMSGRYGNTILVNGHRHPVLQVRRGEPQLLRIVNSANARTMVLQLPWRSLTWIGTDGGLLAEPQVVDALALSPGERADVLFTIDDGVGSETDLEVAPMRDGMMGGGMMNGGMMMHGRLGDDGATYKALRIRVVDGAARDFDPLPQRLADVPAPQSGRERTLTFDGGMMSGFTIDGESWPDVTPLRAHVGDVETWTLDNRTGIAHPFHLHGNRFQVSSIRGWKDDVLVPAYARVTLTVALDGAPGAWMFHCHILEHAEGGMMGELDLAP